MEPDLERSESEQGSSAGKEGENKAPDVAAELAAIKAENAALLKVADGAKREAEGAKAYVSQLMSTLQNAAENGNGPLAEGEEAESIKEQFERDPLSVMEKHYNARTAPLIQASQEQLAQQNREIARLNLTNQKLWEDGPTVWGQYGEEIDEFMNKFGPDVRSKPDAYEAAVRWVRTKHFDDEFKARSKQQKEKENATFAEGASAGSAGSKKAAPVLSDAEKTVARKLGISEADYLAYRDSAEGAA